MWVRGKIVWDGLREGQICIQGPRGGKDLSIFKHFKTGVSSQSVGISILYCDIHIALKILNVCHAWCFTYQTFGKFFTCLSCLSLFFDQHDIWEHCLRLRDELKGHELNEKLDGGSYDPFKNNPLTLDSQNCFCLLLSKIPLSNFP